MLRSRAAAPTFLADHRRRPLRLPQTLFFPATAASCGRACYPSPANSSAAALHNPQLGPPPREWIHFVGVGGCGLSALAMLALHQGFDVTGSDIAWNGSMDRLERAGAELRIGHSPMNIQREGGKRVPSALVVSSAIPGDNVEIRHAYSAGIPVYKRGRWLEKITGPYRVIAVSRTHGKTTTSSMLAYVLDGLGATITAVIGGHAPHFSGGNVIAGCGQDFVVETDEYDGCFFGLQPYIAGVTNLEWEHVDMFCDLEAVKSAFRKFIAEIREGGYLILCTDSPGACYLLHETQDESLQGEAHDLSSPKISHCHYNVITYGLSPTNKWSASSILSNAIGGSDYDLLYSGCQMTKISLPLPGIHNVLNSLAVIAAVTAVYGAEMTVIEAIECAKKYLSCFMGVNRRFQLVGKIFGCHIYDDYAHHPTAICSTLQAARQIFPYQTLYVIFQPHTYSRLAAFMKEFCVAFGDADHVIVTEVYSVRETNAFNINGWDLSARIIGPSSEYIPREKDIVDRLVLEVSSDITKEIVILTMGAGNINILGPKLLQELRSVCENDI